jgi:hypothetical protein
MIKMILDWIKATPYGIPATIGIVVVAGAAGVLSYTVFGLPVGNPVEKDAEIIIEDAANLAPGTVNLAPFSKKTS